VFTAGSPEQRLNKRSHGGERILGKAQVLGIDGGDTMEARRGGENYRNACEHRSR
jgi:hypothetical protein